MKKLISLLICFAVVFSVSAFALEGENYALFSSSSKVTIPVNEHIGGDANGDGKVSLIDVVALLKTSVGEAANTSYHGLDADENGVIDVRDVLKVLGHIIGNDVGLGTLVPAR